MAQHRGLGRLRRKLAGHKRFGDFAEGDMGRDLCRIFTDGVMESIAKQQAPDGTAWAPLSDSYSKWKARNFPSQGMGVLHYLMADPAQVSGVVEVTRNAAICTYGVSPAAREEATWFQEGGVGRPPRRFWGFTGDSLKKVKAYLDARLVRILK